MQTQEIHDLVRRSQTGDKEAKTVLVEMFLPLIRRAAGQAHLTVVREDAEQEATLALLGAIEDFDANRGVPFPGYAKALVFGRVRTFFLKERRRWQREVMPVSSAGEEEESEDFFARVADERDAIGALEEAESFRAELASLPKRERNILSMYYEKGQPLRVIGEQMGMTAKHVAVVKARAMKKLRQSLDVVRLRRRRPVRSAPLSLHRAEGGERIRSAEVSAGV